jgi:diguanylate cyclase (GGDEF)-like protein/PAS domain S-box-containing protein
MSLRNKFFALVVLLLITLVGVMTFSSGKVMLQSFDTIERHFFEWQASRVAGNLQFVAEELLYSAANLSRKFTLDEAARGKPEIDFPLSIVVVCDLDTNALRVYHRDSSERTGAFSSDAEGDLLRSLHRIFDGSPPVPKAGLLRIDGHNFLVGIVPLPEGEHTAAFHRALILAGRPIEEALPSIFRTPGEKQYQLLDAGAGNEFSTLFGSSPEGDAFLESSALLEGGSAIRVVFSSDTKAFVYHALTSLTGETPLFLRAEWTRPLHEEARRILANRITWGVPIGVLSLVIVLLIFDRLILLRLERIQKVVDTITARWRFNLRVEVTGNDEITRLSQSFNTMIDTLHSLVMGVPDPLFLVDPEDCVMLANVAACQLLGCEKESDLMGRALSSIIIADKSPVMGKMPVIDKKPDEANDDSLWRTHDIFEASVLRNNRTLVPVEIHRDPLSFGKPGLKLLIARDLTDRRTLEERLVQMAFYDAPTGLPNRHSFLDDLEREIRLIETTSGYAFSVVLLNLDKFKLVNEQMGTRDADLVLLEITRRVTGITEGFAGFYRVGGDEFAIIVRGTSSKDYVVSLLLRIQRLIGAPVLVHGKTISPSVSFGVVLETAADSTCDIILNQLSDALIVGKKRGMGNITFHSPEMASEYVERPHRNLLNTQVEMRHALQSHQFVVYLQPIYQLTPLGLTGFEALARWVHPTQGVLAPNAFIPMAEETGLITRLDRSIIQQSIAILKKWTHEYPSMPVSISANASGASLTDPDFIPFIQEQIREISLAPEHFVLEVTEGVLIRNLKGIQTQLSRLREMGVKISLDDFGTGFSSLQYINQLPIDWIKIDKSFMDQLFQTDKTLGMVRSILNMADELGLGIVAEGVESENQVHWLTENGSDVLRQNLKGQGYFFSRPVPQTEAESLLADALAFRDCDAIEYSGQ